MLEIRNLTKIYRSKTGDEVKALDNVSITFPETGMVFILGKSGSGKSTLLNVMGGLDAYDDGEFIIKGKSSKEFVGSDFDAYRNTFIGFIFQEYNVLDDFTVGANIGLALELQGKKADDETINKILSQVDLLNYAKRKPNELSGGQKQRVAIARALVKDPQIIMADEPTGALDSNTGKQIFDTLKELSKTKLVLIVSHDRDFAERYADRIVELADGKIISDVTKHERQSIQLSDGIQQINDRILRIKGGYRLTERDLQMINDYLTANSNDIILSGDGRINDELRSAAGISAEGNTSVFEETDGKKDVKLRSYEKKDSHFIRSRLPIKNALRMGASGLKHKKFRLVMTIFLSLIAFALFGFADTLGAYEKENAAVASVLDSHVKNASVSLGVKHTMIYDGDDPYSYYSDAMMNDNDIQYLRDQTGLDFVPVFTAGDRWNGGFSASQHFKAYQDNSEAYTGKLSGLVTMSDSQLASAEMSLLAGRLPQGAGEIAISELMLRQFNQYGFTSSTKNGQKTIESGSVTADTIIGQYITLSANGMSYESTAQQPTYKIVGVIDTAFDYNRYERFLPAENESPKDEDDSIAAMVLQNELETELFYGFHMLGYVHQDDLTSLASAYSQNRYDIGTDMYSYTHQMYLVISSDGDVSEESKEEIKEEMHLQKISCVAGSDAIAKLGKNIVWFNGAKTSLAPNEIILPYHIYSNLTPSEIEYTLDPTAFATAIDDKCGTGTWESRTDKETDYYNQLGSIPDDQKLKEAERSAANYLVSLIFGEKFVESLPQYAIENLLGTVLRDITNENALFSISDYEAREFYRKFIISQDFESLSDSQWKTLKDLYFDDDSQESHDKEIWEALDESRKNDILLHYYELRLSHNSYDEYYTGLFGKRSGEEIQLFENKKWDLLVQNHSLDALNSLSFSTVEESYENATEATYKEYSLTVVGYLSSSYQGQEMVICDTIKEDYLTWSTDKNAEEGVKYHETVAEHEDGLWSFAIAPMGDEDALRKLVQLTYDEESDLQFSLENAVMNTLDSFNEFIEIGSQVFLYIGIGFAVFSALLLMNFISTSISYKKREIGILRAVGARSSDVFKIFFSEALIIAMVNFILSLTALIAAIMVANGFMRSQGINITLLTFGPRQVILMLLVSIFVALLASFLPVYNIAKRKPVDAIKDR